MYERNAHRLLELYAHTITNFGHADNVRKWYYRCGLLFTDWLITTSTTTTKSLWLRVLYHMPVSAAYNARNQSGQTVQSKIVRKHRLDYGVWLRDRIEWKSAWVRIICEKVAQFSSSCYRNQFCISWRGPRRWTCRSTRPICGLTRVSKIIVKGMKCSRPDWSFCMNTSP